MDIFDEIKTFAASKLRSSNEKRPSSKLTPAAKDPENVMDMLKDTLNRRRAFITGDKSANESKETAIPPPPAPLQEKKSMVEAISETIKNVALAKKSQNDSASGSESDDDDDWN